MFSKKITPKEGSPVKNGLLWLETASEGTYHRTLTKMWEEIRDLPRYPSDRAKNNGSVYSGALLSRMQKLDRTRMTKKQKTELAKLIFVTIPQKVNKLETALLDPYERGYAVDEFGRFVQATLREQIDPMPRKLPLKEAAAPKPKETKKAVQAIGDRESDQKLTHVKELAQKACASAANVDDQFFAEQALTSYIPESVRLLTGLLHAPEDMKQEAQELFHRQLGVIEKQLDAILRKESASSLDEMKAHTEFLESKDSHLELKKKKPL